MRRSSVLASIALVALPLAACVAPSAPPPPRPAPPVAVPTPAPTPTPPPPPASADWRDWPVTPGTWRYASGSSGSSASYGGGAPDFLFRISCSPVRRSVSLERAGPLGGPSMTIRTTSTARTLPTIAAQHPDRPPVMTHEAALPANDALLDAVGYSRGRFIVESAGAPPLVIPAWAEIQRVIEDCRG